jgi:hypothetical protein
MRKQIYNRVIASRNLPMRMPLMQTALFWLLLDRWQAPGWAWGATGVFLALCWAVWTHDAYTRVSVDVINQANRRNEKDEQAEYY